MMITTLAVACSVIVIMLHFKSIEIRPPQWLRVFIFRYMSRAVCIDHNQKFSNIVNKTRAVPRRETTMTWSETATEEIKSQNSHTLTPDGPESYELFSHRNPHRRSLAVDDNNVEHDSRCAALHRHSNTVRSPSGDLKCVPEEMPLSDLGPLEVKNEWKQMAEVMDRFFFFLFLFFLIVPTATILGIVRLFKPELWWKMQKELRVASVGWEEGWQEEWGLSIIRIATDEKWIAVAAPGACPQRRKLHRNCAQWSPGEFSLQLKTNQVFGEASEFLLQW